MISMDFRKFFFVAVISSSLTFTAVKSPNHFHQVACVTLPLLDRSINGKDKDK